MDAGQRGTYQEGGVLLSQLLLLAPAPKCGDGAVGDMEGVSRGKERLLHLLRIQGEGVT